MRTRSVSLSMVIIPLDTEMHCAIYGVRYEKNISIVVSDPDSMLGGNRQVSAVWHTM